MVKTEVLRNTAVGLIVAATMLAITAIPGRVEAKQISKDRSNTIVGLVQADEGEFDVLQAAVIRADLVGALSGNGQYTVFAPTDAAFIKTLGVANEAAAIEAVNNLPKDALTNILLNHVTHGRRNSSSVLAAPSYKMLNGDRVTQSELLSAGIVSTDISASNGLVHVIGSVLTP
jgi:transforming growth factor-beta-induced protein